MRKKYYEDAKENAAFERCADVITSLIVKYGPSLKRRWELEAMMKNIWVLSFQSVQGQWSGHHGYFCHSDYAGQPDD